MQNKKIIMVIMAFVSIMAFVGTYLFIAQKKEEKKPTQTTQENTASTVQCAYASDQEAYGKMIETADEKICTCINNSELKKTCGGVASDIGFYKKGVADLNADICGNIKDEITRDACVSVVKGGLEYMQNNKQPATQKKEMTTADYAKVRQENPKDVNNLLSLAMAYGGESFGKEEGIADADKINQALAVIEEAKKLEPSNAKVYSTEGYIFKLAAQNDRAVLSYKKSLELDANNSEARAALESLK